MKRILVLIALSFMSVFSFSQDQIMVANIQDFDMAMKKAVPGTTIIMKNGIWEDVHLKVNGIGKRDLPITVKAETPGEVIITGDSRMNIWGTYLVIDGLWFKNGTPTTKSVISFRKNSKDFAYNSRLTNCTVSYYNPIDTSLSTHWVDLWGKNNRVDHCNFTGKTNHGTTLVVWLKGDAHIENNHQIDYNFFGPRPDLGKNGGETIRIGTSKYSMQSSKTLVENNTFKNCDGEIEIISNKSGDNIFRNNLFLASKGTLTLRHGNNALVENNVFLGNGVSKTGGIRIINEGHIVRNNLLIGLKGDGFRGPIVVMNGVPNSPLNRYHQVKNVDIQHNTIINCGPIEFGAGSDKERTLPPISTIFANNLITNNTNGSILKVHDNINGVSFKNNVVDAPSEIDERFFKKATIEWKMIRSLPMPTLKNQALISNFKNDKSPILDIARVPRKVSVVGAFNLNNRRYPPALVIQTGPNWKPTIVPPKVVYKEVIISVEPGTETLGKAIRKASTGTTLKLADGTYYVDKTQKVNGDIRITGTGKTVIKAHNNLPKPLNYFFRVRPNSKLTLDSLIIDGDNDTRVKYAVVSPDKNNPEPYNLFINNSTFKNFTNKKGGSIFKAYVGTKADSIVITNSTFEDSYRGLNLSFEKVFGKYSAEYIKVHNSIFRNIEQYAVNYFKADPTLALAGGKLEVSNSIFSKVGNTEKGIVLKTNGIPDVHIKNSVFVGSYNLRHPVKLVGTSNVIENCLVNGSGSVKTSKNATQKNVVDKNPRWEDKKNFIPGKKSYLLKENNKKETIGLIHN